MPKKTEEQSQLFTVRIWVEDVGNGRAEIRGTVKHILSGETHHFRDWQTLIERLKVLSAAKTPDQSP